MTDDRAADSTEFIEFMLDTITTTLSGVALRSPSVDHRNIASDQVSDQVNQLLRIMGDRYWSTQELMERLALSHRPTFRTNYLNPTLKAGLVVMQYPHSPRSPKQKYKKAQA
ncbi:MAG: hypothetical protein HC929_11755 [Leptolyngbyaceae cyanobacterium SM2_5_2]|nr:hypothetical protein [Leptolyngbyaceae cyanobacterium SM2_5_2]